MSRSKSSSLKIASVPSPAPVKIFRLIDFDRIKNDGFTMTLNPETLQIIQQLASQVGAPGYIKTPIFERRPQTKASAASTKGGYVPSPHQQGLSFTIDVTTANDWDMVRNLKKTVVVEKKEGVNLSIDVIRKHLNKMTDKTYSNLKDQIISEIEVFIANMDDKEKLHTELNKVGDAIFAIASGNSFYSKMYATLYNELMTKYAFMKTIIETNLKNLSTIFQDFAYCDSTLDYDTFCKNNKTNEKRRALSLFYVNLMLQNIIQPPVIINMINELQSYLLSNLVEADKTNIVEEVTEIIAILIVNGISKLQTYEQEWTQIVRNINKVGCMKHKSELSVTNKTIFKHIDILESVNKANGKK